MPIINNFDGNETEITKIVNVVNGVEYDITDVYLADKHVFTVWGETEGALPRTFNANGDNAVEWQVYGETGGVGQRTENLFDTNVSPVNFAMGEPDEQNRAQVVQVTRGSIFIFQIDNSSAKTFTVKIYSGIAMNVLRIAFTNTIPLSNYQYVYDMAQVKTTSNPQVTSTNNGLRRYLLVQISASYIETYGMPDVMLTEGSTAPESYIPYGYEVPMAVGDGNTSNTVNLYIGSTPLDEGEYTSYKDQKIYKYVSGVLTPTDPPVPIPALPTLDGVTVVDTELDSSAVQPEKAYIKYRKENT